MTDPAGEEGDSRLLPSFQWVNPGPQPGQPLRRAHPSLPPLHTQLPGQMYNPVRHQYYPYPRPGVFPSHSYNPYPASYAYHGGQPADFRYLASLRPASPAVMQQPMVSSAVTAESGGIGPQRAAKSRTRLGRVGTSKSMANVASYLASGSRSARTGTGSSTSAEAQSRPGSVQPLAGFSQSGMAMPTPTSAGHPEPPSSFQTYLGPFAPHSGALQLPPPHTTQQAWRPVQPDQDFHTATQSRGEISPYELARTMQLQQQQQLLERQRASARERSGPNAQLQTHGGSQVVPNRAGAKTRSAAARHRSTQSHSVGSSSPAASLQGQGPPSASSATLGTPTSQAAPQAQQRLRLVHRPEDTAASGPTPPSSASALPEPISTDLPGKTYRDPTLTLPSLTSTLSGSAGPSMDLGIGWRGRGRPAGAGDAPRELTAFDMVTPGKVREAQERGIDTSQWGLKGAVPPPPPASPSPDDTAQDGEGK